MTAKTPRPPPTNGKSSHGYPVSERIMLAFSSVRYWKVNEGKRINSVVRLVSPLAKTLIASAHRN